MKREVSLATVCSTLFVMTALGQDAVQKSSATNSVESPSSEAQAVVDGETYSNHFGAMQYDKAAGGNGSFEFTKSGLPLNWVIYRPLVRKDGAELKFDTTDSKDGKQSLEFIVHQGSTDGGWGGWHSAGMFQERKILPKHVYKTTFWIKNQGCKFKVSLETIKNPTHHHEATVLETSETMGSWRKFEFLRTSQEGETSFRFELNIFSPGSLWIDDLRIQEVSP